MNKRAFVVLVGSMFISMLGMGIVSPFLPIYANTLGASKLEVGLVQAGFSITGIGTLLFIGRLSDRFGRKLFLGTGLGIIALSSVGLMYAARPLHLILWRFFQGLGASAHMPIAQAYLGDITPEGHEGKWMGYFNAVLFAGMGAGPLAGGLISDAFSIRTTFLFMAVLNALALGATILFLREMRRKTSRAARLSFLDPLRSRNLRGALSYNIANGVTIAGLMAFVPLFADLTVGLSASLIGVLLAARSPVSILQSYTGRMADKWNRRSMVLWGGLLSMAALALLPRSAGFWPLLAAYISVTLGQAVGVPAANAYVVNEGRVYGMGASVTLFMLAMHLGTGLGPVALGGIADRFGLESVFYSTAACMAMGLGLFALMVRPGADTRVRGSAP
ncbi:MAG: MFS transporter [Acidobacteria bacterium]|jgi:MFS family permease|nr:MFS transporter [Acidobacteriota bacterium]